LNPPAADPIQNIYLNKITMFTGACPVTASATGWAFLQEYPESLKEADIPNAFADYFGYVVDQRDDA